VSALGQVSQIIGSEQAAVCHPKTSKNPETASVASDAKESKIVDLSNS
jgi:hypothetical protein